MTSATYGRLRIGKCVPEKYSSELGYSTDVLAFMSRQCSGRQTCSFSVQNLVLDHEKGCPPSIIRSYLEVSFTCLRGLKTTLFSCVAYYFNFSTLMFNKLYLQIFYNCLQIYLLK